jgi:succinyl-diaminopimelate desuccinylase
MQVEKLAQKLIQFESTHQNPAQLDACLEYCVSYFSSFSNVKTHRFESNGVRSIVLANNTLEELDVLLLGHIDTVPGDASLFMGRVEGDRLYGRGSLDMKAFVATSMKVFEEVLKSNTDKKVALAIVTDEELGGADGAKYLVERANIKPKVVLVPDDGEDLHVIVKETKHIYQIDFQAHGLEAHANRPWDGDNAILKLFETYVALKSKLNVPDQKPDDEFIDTCNLGLVSGGVASNEVPESAQMVVDIRISSGITKDELKLIIDQSLIDGVSYTISLEGQPTNLDTNSEIVQKYIECIQRETDTPIAFKRAGGATDARYFAKYGIVTIVHQSHGRDAQAKNEYVSVSDLQKLITIQTNFILS